MDIANIIQYEGDNSTFIWKHPCKDFNTTSQLIVHESQEAVFYMNGQILDKFEAGRHTLETQNIPLISKFFNKAFNKETPFHCEVYFINKTEQMAIKWGTDSHVEYIEPAYAFPVQLGASGEMILRVEDACKLLVKIVGTESNLSQTGLTQKFRAFLMTKFKTYISNYIKSNKINIFEIDERLQEISDNLHKMLVPDFLEYGLFLVNFFVTTVVKPENNPYYAKFKALHYRLYTDVAEAKLQQSVSIIKQETEKQRTILEAEGLASKRQIEGYTYHQERSFDVAEKVASNQSVGEYTNMGIGLGVMAGVGGTVGNIVGGSLDEAIKPQKQANAKCTKCGAALPPNAKFCLECGIKTEPVLNDKIICPACGKETPSGKFCIECGEKLHSTCFKCGKDAPAGAKYCLNCGEKLGGNKNE